MKPASARQKGKRLEYKVASLIRTKGLDHDARRMPLSGGFSHLPSDIYTSLPYAFECKNQETVKLWAWWEQTQGQTRVGHKPVLVISGNFRPILAVVDIDTLLNLLRIEKEVLDGAA